MEKQSDVSVNETVWLASVPSGLLYLAFGIAGSSAFPRVTDNVLVALGSEHVDPLTNICSCLFGVLIIGLGVPIFCVLMHQNLHAGGMWSRPVALFLGGGVPYVIGWTCYQGHVALNMLAWAGLLFTGFVAFIGPMIVCLVAAKNINAVDWTAVTVRKGGKYEALTSHVKLERHTSVRGARGSVFPLPEALEASRYWILVVMLVVFSTMVACAIVTQLLALLQ